MSEFLKAYCAKAAEQSCEEVVAELVRAEERGARAFMLDLWRAYQAREAAREAEKAPVGEMPAVWSARFRHEQATRCAGCGERKHPPPRADAMGGYVCMTCIDKRLEDLLAKERQDSAEIT